MAAKEGRERPPVHARALTPLVEPLPPGPHHPRIDALQGVAIARDPIVLLVAPELPAEDGPLRSDGDMAVPLAPSSGGREEPPQARPTGLPPPRERPPPGP